MVLTNAMKTLLFIVSLGAMFLLSPLLSLVMLAVGPLLLFTAMLIGRGPRRSR